MSTIGQALGQVRQQDGPVRRVRGSTRVKAWAQSRGLVENQVQGQSNQMAQGPVWEQVEEQVLWAVQDQLQEDTA